MNVQLNLDSHLLWADTTQLKYLAIQKDTGFDSNQGLHELILLVERPIQAQVNHRFKLKCSRENAFVENSA